MRSDNEALDPESAQILEAALRNYGIGSQPSTTPRHNGRELDSFNAQLRESPVWRQFMQRNGVDLSRPIKLSDRQRKALQAELERNGVRFDKSIEIDPAGNVNQDQKPGKKIAIGAAIGGLALIGFGAAGIGPMAGLMGGGAAAAGGAGATAAGSGGVLASSSLPAAMTMGAAAPAITSAGVSAGVGAAGAAGAAGSGGLTTALGAVGRNHEALRGAGVAAGAAAGSMASNRGVQIDASMGSGSNDGQ